MTSRWQFGTCAGGRAIRPPLAFLARAAAGCALLAAAGPGACADATGAQEVARARQAYRALGSYRGDVQVVGATGAGGPASTVRAAAHIEFSRPGGIRVEGAVMSGAGRFGYVSDGASVWLTGPGASTSWRAVTTVEAAIAAYTGVSMYAGTTVPALLAGCAWGDPFSGFQPASATPDRVGGRDVIRVAGAGPGMLGTFWFDRGTHLLAKVHRRWRTGLQEADRPGAASTPGGFVLDVTETFTGTQTGVAISPSRFAPPAGAGVTPQRSEPALRPAPSAGSSGLPAGITASDHFLQRMRERGVSVQELSAVLRDGQRYYDPRNDSHIRWRDGVYVALTASGVIKTVIRGPVERRWRPE